MAVTPEHWQRVRTLLEQALDLPASERARFLAHACDEDALRDEVGSLMAGATSTHDLHVDLPAADVLRDLLAMRFGQRVRGLRIGRYELRRVLGCGGMGTVFEAAQEAPQRLVALKTMRFGFGSDAAVRRFRWETEVLARLNHPNVAQIYEAGVHVEDVGGERLELPYFAMELVEGAQPLMDSCRGEPLPARVARLVAACRGVQDGHRRGVVHRDLKPGNLLVDRHGQVKVIDFGVARVTAPDASVAITTDAGDAVGTLRYMSPEQLAGDPADLDVRTDVYSLGVVLYELLCGLPPYGENAPLGQLAGMLRREPPVPLRQRDATIPQDLERIVLQAMAHDRERRYETAGALADDLQRWCDGAPVLAAGATSLYRLRKTLARHGLAVGFAGIALLALAGGFALATTCWLDARRQHALARTEAEQSAAVVEFLRQLLVGAHPAHEGPDVRLRDVFAEATERIDAFAAARPAAGAPLHETIGTTLHGLGDLAAAAHHLQRAVELRDRNRVPPTRATMAAERQLGRVLSELGRLDEADRVFRRLTQRAADSFGHDDSFTHSCRSMHATVLARLDRAAEAAVMLEEVLIASGRSDDTLETLAHANNLVTVLVRTGESERAESLARRTRDETAALLGETHPKALVAAMNHGATLLGVDRADEAAQVLARIAEVRAAQLGPGHPDVVVTWLWLSRAHAARGDLVAADRALAVAIAGDAPGSALASDLRIDAAALLLRQGRRSEAGRALRALLADAGDATALDGRQRRRAEDLLQQVDAAPADGR